MQLHHRIYDQAMHTVRLTGLLLFLHPYRTREYNPLRQIWIYHAYCIEYTPLLFLIPYLFPSIKHNLVVPALNIFPAETTSTILPCIFCNPFKCCVYWAHFLTDIIIHVIRRFSNLRAITSHACRREHIHCFINNFFFH